MDIHNLLVLISSLIFAVSMTIYVLDVKHSRVKPNIASFIVWSFANISLLVSLIVANVWTSVPFVAMAALVSIVICVLSLRSGKFYISKFDILVLILGLLGVVAWIVTKEAAWNVYIISVVDVLSWSAIIAKTFKNPHFETKLAWHINFLGSIPLVLAVPRWEVVEWIVPVVQLVFSGTLNAILLKHSFDQSRNKAA